MQGLYYLLSFGDMVMIMQLWLIRSSFPYNYLMMTVPCSAQLRRQLRVMSTYCCLI